LSRNSIAWTNPENVAVSGSQQDITNVLRNERPTGNSLLNSRYVVDPINKKTKYNRGEQSRYYVENSHEDIVSQELSMPCKDK